MDGKLAIFFVCITVCTCVKIPSTLKQCNRKDRDFSECLRTAVQHALMYVKAPIKEIGLLDFEPLEISSMVIGAGTGPVAFEQKYKNMKIVGFPQAKVIKADMNFDTNTLTMHAVAPRTRADFEYEGNGQILVLPVRGKGPGFVEMYDLDVVVTFNLEEYEKKGEKYYKITSTKFVMTPQTIKLKLDNLFSGDKALADHVNRVINENASELFADVKPSYEEAFGKLFENIFNRVLAKVSQKELFGDP